MQNYPKIINIMKELIWDNELDITILANTSALLYEMIPNINWVGFYLFRNNLLLLGPFQGKPACTKIPLEKGVCGACATTLATINVPDVHQFKGHIACDSASKSELCVPILLHGRLYAILDIDSPSVHRFTLEDQKGIEQIRSILQKELEKIID